MLSGSVYYPSCRFDGDPVMHLAGNFHSFIYVDYGVGRDELVRRLDEFRGYRIVAFRDVTERELTPNGWTPQYPRTCRRSPPSQAPPGSGLRSAFGRSTSGRNSMVRITAPIASACSTSVGDDVATFALYHGNGVAPAVVAVIQPGHGFGGNWTDLRIPNASSLVRCSAILLAPEYLLFGGWGEGEPYRQPCWPEYGVGCS